MPAYPPNWIARSEQRFGTRVRTLRKNLEKSQQDIAEALAARHGLNLHQTAVAKIEAGTRPVKLTEALAIADVLGVHVDELLDRPQDSSAADQQLRAELHARLSEVQTITRDLGKRERQLKDHLQRAGGDEGGEHPEAP